MDSPARMKELIDWCRRNQIDQLTVRPIRRTTAPSHDEAIWKYVGEHELDQQTLDAITTSIEQDGTRLMSLMPGAYVYDIAGQNVCLSDCLTVDAKSDDIRTLIFYSDGRLTYDWQYDGALILRGVSNDVRAAQT